MHAPLAGAYLPPPTINGMTNRFRYHAEMVDDDLARVIAQALADARQRGLDHIGQTDDHAIRAVLAARPDMTASDAMWQVERLRPIGAQGEPAPRGPAISR